MALLTEPVPWRCTAGVTPASTRTRDRWTEARTGSVPLNGTCDDTASWPPQRPADGQQRAALRREGDGTRPRGLIIPSRRKFSTAPAERLIPLVSTRDIGVHTSSPVSSMCLRAKDHLEGTKVAVFPRYCAPQKVQTGSAAAGGYRRVATRKTTGDLATRRGAGRQNNRWLSDLRASLRRRCYLTGWWREGGRSRGVLSARESGLGLVTYSLSSKGHEWTCGKTAS